MLAQVAVFPPGPEPQIVTLRLLDASLCFGLVIHSWRLELLPVVMSYLRIVPNVVFAILLCAVAQIFLARLSIATLAFFVDIEET